MSTVTTVLVGLCAGILWSRRGWRWKLLSVALMAGYLALFWLVEVRGW